MGLSDNLLSQFAKMTVGDKKTRTESTVMGTVKEYADSKYVQIDGSELLTPVSSTTDAVAGDRVTVLIKDHTATITGNITSPSARLEHVKQIEADVGTLVAENVIITGKLTAYEAEIGTLKANDVTITGTLNAAIADIGLLSADNVTIKGTLTAAVADIGTLKTDKLSAKDADIKYAQIDFANIGEAAVEKLFAESGIIRDLVMKDGVITGELTSVTINGDLINANTLKADRLVIKGKDGLYYQLNVNGVKEGEVDENGIEIEQTNENSFDGTYIMAKSVTASKIDVSDLVAFNATIGGFQIGDTSIYSGKPSVDSGTRGIYMDKTGQLALGDSNDYIKYYQDAETGEWKLKMKASEFTFALSNGESVDDAIAKTLVLTEEEFYQSDSPTSLTGGSWSKTQPTWTEGKYIWRRTKNTYNKKDENGDWVFDYSPSENGVCITGNTGSQGDPGDPGDPGKGIKSVTKYYGVNNSKSVTPTAWDTEPVTTTETDKYLWTYEITEYTDGEKVPTTPIIIGIHGEKGNPGDPGDPGMSVTSVDIQYYLSSSSASLTGGSWSTDAPTWVNGKYMWSKTVITYSDTSTSESDPICITGAKGSTGGTGKGVSSIVEQYYQSTSNTTQTGGNWSTSVPTWSDGKYIWTRSVITYTDGTTTTTTPVCVTGGKGATGSAGKGIKSIAEKYAVSSSSSTAPSTWYDTMQTMTTTNKYLWNYEIITYTDNTTSETTKRVIGVYGNTGGTGKGIKSIAEKYAVSSSNSNAPTTWYDSVQTMSSTNKYLWNYEIITYTDNTTSETDKRVIGAYGNTGSTGKGISSTAITYQSSTSGTTAPTGTWSNSIPSVSAGSYLWTRTVITYTDNTTSTSYSVAKMGSTGSTGKGIKSTSVTYQAGTSGTSAPTGTWSTTIPSLSAGQYLWTKTVITYTDNTTSTSYCVGMKGATGATGNGVKSTAVTYQSSSSGTTTPTGTWSSSVPSVSQGYYLWTRTVITYTDNTTATSYSVGRMGSDGAPGKDGQMLYATCQTAASTQYKVATLSTGGISSLTAGVSVTVKFQYANTTAEPTLNVNSTGNIYIKINSVDTSTTNPFYWEANTVLTFVFDGSSWVVVDTMTTHAKMTNGGLVIGNYSSSGTLGNNVFIDTDKVDIRGGSIVYASYGANLIELGKNSTSSVISLCDGTATMKYAIDSVWGDGFTIDGPELLDLTADTAVRMATEYDGTSGGRIYVQSHSGTTKLGAVQIEAYNSTYVRSAIEMHSGSARLTASNANNEVVLQLDPSTPKVFISGGDLEVSGGLYVDGTINALSNLDVDGILYAYDNVAMTYQKSITGYNQSGTAIKMVTMSSIVDSGTTRSMLEIGDFSSSTNGPERMYFGIKGASLKFYNSNNATVPYYFHPEVKDTYACGSATYPWYRFYGKLAESVTSDRRQKENITSLGISPTSTYSLRGSIDVHSELFDRLKPVQYNYINGDGRICYGLIAQDVIESMGELGIEENELDLVSHDEESDSYSIAYTNLIAMLIHEVQKLKSRVSELENS